MVKNGVQNSCGGVLVFRFTGGLYALHSKHRPSSLDRKIMPMPIDFPQDAVVTKASLSGYIDSAEVIT